MAAGANQRRGGLPFDEEAKLVYGVVLSLRNMVKKLTGSCVSLQLCALLVIRRADPEPCSSASLSLASQADVAVPELRDADVRLASVRDADQRPLRAPDVA
jgi:hypothetical protein